MPVHPDVVDLVHELLKRAREDAYGNGATDGYERGFADGEQQSLDKGRQSAPLQNVQPDPTPTNEKGNAASTAASAVWPTQQTQNPYDPSRPLREAYPYLAAADKLSVAELGGRFERYDQETATILALQRHKIYTIGNLIDLPEEYLLSKEIGGIGQVRINELRAALQSLNDEVAKNSD